MATVNDKIKKILAMIDGATTEGEARAASLALQRLLVANDMTLDEISLSDLLDLLEREHECCAYDRPCHMYDLQRAIEGGREYKGFHFEYMVPPSVSGER